MFVIGSKTPATFDRVKDVVSAAIDSPTDIDTKYGIVEYGEMSNTIVTLGDYYDNLELMNIVKDLTWKTRGRDVFGGLEKARRLFESDGRPEAFRRLVVFVDSQATFDEVARAAKSIRKANIKVLTVLVGEFSKEITPGDQTIVDVPSKDPRNTSLLIEGDIFKGK